MPGDCPNVIVPYDPSWVKREQATLSCSLALTPTSVTWSKLTQSQLDCKVPCPPVPPTVGPSSGPVNPSAPPCPVVSPSSVCISTGTECTATYSLSMTFSASSGVDTLEDWEDYWYLSWWTLKGGSGDGTLYYLPCLTTPTAGCVYSLITNSFTPAYGGGGDGEVELCLSADSCYYPPTSPPTPSPCEFSDDFNRADYENLGPDWTVDFEKTWGILSNKACVQAAPAGQIRTYHRLPEKTCVDQYITATTGVFPGVSYYRTYDGLLLKFKNIYTVLFESWYGFGVGGFWHLLIERAGSTDINYFVPLSTYPFDPNSAVTLTLCRVGDTLTAYLESYEVFSISGDIPAEAYLESVGMSARYTGGFDYMSTGPI